MHSYLSPSTEYPSLPRRITRPHLLHFVGSYVGGFSSFSKLNSLVPYQTYISC